MRMDFVYMIIISALFLSSCREKTSDLCSCNKGYSFDMPFKYLSGTDSLNNRFPGFVQGYGLNLADSYLDNFADWYTKGLVPGVPQWAAVSWIPFELLKVRRLNSDQISQIYGPPVFRKAFIIQWYEYDYSEDKSYILEKVGNPYEVIHEFVWAVDSVNELDLRMYCQERSEGVYTPVYGYQYRYFRKFSCE